MSPTKHAKESVSREPGEQLHTGDDPETDIRHFEGSFLKVNRDGVVVLSSTLEPGETRHAKVDDRSTYHENEKPVHQPATSPAEKREERAKAEAKS